MRREIRPTVSIWPEASFYPARQPLYPFLLTSRQARKQT